ncbi:cathelicidin-4-like [Gracilinanus agilis]|uniref:cathelicidin-4-like n=1 Tax=Gracilinanus agilis TaxID=191870 RepID=UPI001CFF1352|nr:cathelicidin-4-like [Gracilinanus agilis]
MELLRKVLLMASVATLLSAQVLPQSSPSYEKALSAVIHFHNQVHGTENAFKVLQVHPPPSNQNPQDQRLKLLRITLKETVCPRTEELPLNQCDFKRYGLVKKCQASVSNEQDITAIILTCDPGALLSFRSRRSVTKMKKTKADKYHHLLSYGYSRKLL